MEPTILTSGLFDRVDVVRRTVYRLALALLGATLLAYPFAAQLLHIVQLPLSPRERGAGPKRGEG